MPLMPHMDAALVFDAADSADTGEYAIYSIRPHEIEGFKRGEWDVMKASLEPTRSVPVSDVECDEAKHEIRVLTYGLERFARAG
jgi:hypothetical protein